MTYTVGSLVRVRGREWVVLPESTDKLVRVPQWLDPAAGRQGLGKALLTALVEVAEANGIWTLQAGVFRENASSISLHRTCDFREVGYRERLGQLHGVWRDVVLMERRSSIVGL